MIDKEHIVSFFVKSFMQVNFTSTWVDGESFQY